VSTAGVMVNDWVTEAALYDGFAPEADAGADALILHTPTPVMAPLRVHGPDAVKVTGCPSGMPFDSAVALNENVPPYCTFGKVGQLIVCGSTVEPAGSIVNDSDTEFAAS